MSSPKNMNARERARLAAEQAAARKRDQRILIAVIAGFVLVVVAAGIGFQAWRTTRSPSAAPSSSVSGATPVTISDGRPIVLGSPQAPATISLYEDFHCPHCAEFEEQFGPVIREAQESGAARVELYPLSFIDEGSAAAANAMACAAEAGFGQNYYLGLFANHTLRWSDEQLIDLAAKVGGSPSATFTACVTSKTHAGWVSSIAAAADKNGVTGTPTMFINGELIDIQSLTPEALRTMITSAAQK